MKTCGKKSAIMSTAESKLLIICRHAKSSWQDASLSDRERPLNKRGERDAPEMGKRLAKRGIHPDLIITSPAERARRTAELYAQALHYPLESMQINPAQYAASVPTLLELLRQTSTGCRSVLMVGHNPESTGLANLLGGLSLTNVPTSGIVALKFAISNWQDLQAGRGVLLFFDYPKNVP